MVPAFTHLGLHGSPGLRAAMKVDRSPLNDFHDSLYLPRMQSIVGRRVAEYHGQLSATVLVNAPCHS
jgi:hypothetical protein